MSVDVLNCPLCGSAQSSPFDRRSFRGLPVTNLLCKSCGLVYQSPRMSDEELSAFYEQEYRPLYQGSSGPVSKDLAVQKQRAEWLYGFAQGKLSHIERHLDVGCSAGLLLQRFNLGYSCQSVGIEPGSSYRSYAQQQGLAVYPTLDKLAASNPHKFDLVSMAHVLEHIPNPVEYLADLKETLLSPEGWLLVEVPNLYAHDCFEVAHLVSYSPHTLTQVLKKSGFEVTYLQPHGEPRSRIIPLYLTALAQPVQAASEVFQPAVEKAVRRKRKWGLLQRRLLARLFPRQAWLPVTGF
ncbi:MAG: class I SAM-dependent methyltransferase [Anaerolineales bacterium]